MKHFLIRITSVILYFICFGCSNHNVSPKDFTEISYIISFTGDTNDFIGRISANTISMNSFLESESFQDKGNNQFSDNKFDKEYELTLKTLNENGDDNKVVNFAITALCISDGPTKRLYGKIVKKNRSNILGIEEFQINSISKNETPYPDYTKYSFSTSF